MFYEMRKEGLTGLERECSDFDATEAMEVQDYEMTR